MSSRYHTEYQAQYTRKDTHGTDIDVPLPAHRSRHALQYPFVDNKSTVADILGLPDDNHYGERFSSMGIAARKRAAQNVFQGMDIKYFVFSRVSTSWHPHMDMYSQTLLKAQ